MGFLACVASLFLPLQAQDLRAMESIKPAVRFLHAPTNDHPQARILVLIEQRLLEGVSLTLKGGSAVLSRYLDDLVREGWEPYAYAYDVRSHETGAQAHRHLPSEFLDLYRTLRAFYRASAATLRGVVLIGDFPSAGLVTLADVPVGGKVEQHEMDYFGVDVILADPLGNWEWLPVAPMIAPGSKETVRLPYDEERHPNGKLHARDEWSAPGFVIMHQWEMPQAKRTPKQFGSRPEFWVGRISAAQTAWRTGEAGWEWSSEEEIRLLVSYFERNHQHRTRERAVRGYLFVDHDFAGGWQEEKQKLEAIIPSDHITVHADHPNFAAGKRATLKNFAESFRQDYLICGYDMHSDWLNHYFNDVPKESEIPSAIEKELSSEGSGFNIKLPNPAGSVKAAHIMGIQNRSPLGRFYFLSGCDVGDILHRPRWLHEGEQISLATPVHRQYGAMGLGLSYLMHANGLAVLAHNVTNPKGDYTTLFRTWGAKTCLGDAILAHIREENERGLPHYRNVLFGDPTLRVRY